MNIEPGCMYISSTQYIDIDTGEILRTENAKNKEKYIIIKTHKKTEYNANKTKGHIRYTRECRKQPQLQLNFDH